MGAFATKETAPSLQSAPISGPLAKLRAKYEDLVWYARKQTRGHASYAAMPPAQREAVFKNMDRVEVLYPAEVNKLRSSEQGAWEHGFNSGCLASFRLALELIDALSAAGGAVTDEGGLANVIQSHTQGFPSLDT